MVIIVVVVVVVVVAVVVDSEQLVNHTVKVNFSFVVVVLAVWVILR